MSDHTAGGIEALFDWVTRNAVSLINDGYDGLVNAATRAENALIHERIEAREERDRQAQQIAALTEQVKIAEWVGCYFGLERVCNMKLYGEPRTINRYRATVAEAMKDAKSRVHAGTIDSWPRARSALADGGKGLMGIEPLR